MQPIVSDAGPLQYLVLTQTINVLYTLFGRVLVPEVVVSELSHPATPLVVRAWLDAAPAWLERRSLSEAFDDQPRRGAGERAAIELALVVDAPLLLIDDRAGDTKARTLGLQTIGTLGVLVRASQLGLVDLETAFSRLRMTNFRCRSDFLEALLAKHATRRA